MQRNDIITIKLQAIDQSKPSRDSAFALLVAIVVDQTAPPLAPRVRIRAPRDESRILHRDHRLIIVAVERPSLHLPLRAFTAMQEFMKRMQPMIPRGPDLTQPRFEFIGRQQVQTTISIPSSAISKPAASTFRRSGEPCTKIGFVLL